MGLSRAGTRSGTTVRHAIRLTFDSQGVGPCFEAMGRRDVELIDLEQKETQSVVPGGTSGVQAGDVAQVVCWSYLEWNLTGCGDGGTGAARWNAAGTWFGSGL